VSLLGLAECIVNVAPQILPDPAFPTVRFPNPEEAGALDLAMETADAEGCRLVFANDPDADRFAAAEHTEEGWKIFSGNEMGFLLAYYSLACYLRTKGSDLSRVYMIASTVSSRALSAMARAGGFHFAETLTGFKWIGNKALELRRQGFDVIFGFEEALGYMPEFIPDKDGITAAAAFISLAAETYAEGRTLSGVLRSLGEIYGFFRSCNHYYVSTDPRQIDALFAHIRGLGSPFPGTVAGHRVVRWRDLTTGYDSGTPDNVPELPTSASSHMITCELESTRFTVRGSGTEPKVKVYVESLAATCEEADEMAAAVAAALQDEWFLPAFGLARR
jgi:phosphoglucomutase